MMMVEFGSSTGNAARPKPPPTAADAAANALLQQRNATFGSFSMVRSGSNLRSEHTSCQHLAALQKLTATIIASKFAAWHYLANVPMCIVKPRPLTAKTGFESPRERTPKA